MLPRCILRLIELFDPHAIEYGKFVVMHECTIMINCCFKLDTPVSLSVFSLIPDLLFDFSRVLEYAKIRTVLQSKLDIPFHGFFDFFIWTSSEKSVDTTEKSAIKLIKLPNLKVIC